MAYLRYNLEINQFSFIHSLYYLDTDFALAPILSPGFITMESLWVLLLDQICMYPQMWASSRLLASLAQL